METTKKGKKFLPEVIKERTYEFELTGPYKPINYGIGRESVVYDPIEGTERAIRYVPGWESIIVADQPDIEERLIPKVDLNFSHGELKVPGNKTQLVQYLILHDHNEGNSNKISNITEFRLIDRTGELKLQRETARAKSDAIARALDSPFEEVIPFAKVLGVDTSKLAGEEQVVYEDRIRTRFLDKAEKNPTSFLKGFEDPAHKREYDVILGFEQSVITDSLREGEVSWTDSKQLITKLPAGTNTAAKTKKFLTDFTFTEQGKEFYANLKKLIKY